MDLILIIIIGYLLGSIPTAFLVMKRKGLNILQEGSGNVGTLNSYEVSNSKRIGLIVLLVDTTKGFLSVVLVKLVFDDQFLQPMLALISAVFGHCYSVWIKFKGGRGLATAAGGAVALSPIILILWFIFWLLIYLAKKHIHMANIFATITVIITAILFSESLNKLSFPPADTSFIFGFYLSLLMIIILSKHIEPLRQIINKK